MPAKCDVDSVESARILQKPGAKSGTLHIVVGGKSMTFKLPREKILVLIESGVEAIRKQGQTI